MAIKWTPKDVIDRMAKVLSPSQNETGRVNLWQQLKNTAKGLKYPQIPQPLLSLLSQRK